MLVLKKISEIRQNLDALRKGLPADQLESFKMGFVPTMGALHDGHISLVKKAESANDITIVSIFVNPTQFSNPEDLKNYPRNSEKDLALLESHQVSIVFIPDVNEMYPKGANETAIFNFGRLEEVMEGKFRQGHFKGVAQVVSKLFEIVNPDKAYFGEKDFQQLAVIRELVKQKKYPIEIIGCPTVREPNGLAMSSRNECLTPEERIEAEKISKALFFIRDNWRELSVEEAKAKAKSIIEGNPPQDGFAVANSKMKIEYLEIATEETLEPITEWNTESNNIRCFVAVQAGKVRLIDNVRLNTTFAA